MTVESTKKIIHRWNQALRSRVSEWVISNPQILEVDTCRLNRTELPAHETFHCA